MNYKYALECTCLRHNGQLAESETQNDRFASQIRQNDGQWMEKA